MAESEITEALRRFRRGKNWTQQAIADMLGLKRTTYTSYEQGIASPPKSVLDKLRSYGFDDVGDMRGVTPQRPVALRYIGAVSASSRAGWTDPREVDEVIAVPPEMGGDERFACTVESDSCFDLLWPGDTAIFHRCQIPKMNHVMLFRSTDNQLTIKQVKHNGTDWILHPLNAKYTDEPADGSVVGFLVGILRQQGSRRITVYDEFGILP